MAGKGQIAQIKLGLQEGIGLERCRKCGCMRQGLENPSSTFPSVQVKGSSIALENIEHWLKLWGSKKRGRRT